MTSDPCEVPCGFLLSSFLIIVPIVLLGSAAAILLPQLRNPDLAVLALASKGFVPAWGGGLLLAGTLAWCATACPKCVARRGNSCVLVPNT